MCLPILSVRELVVTIATFHPLQLQSYAAELETGNARQTLGRQLHQLALTGPFAILALQLPGGIPQLGERELRTRSAILTLELEKEQEDLRHNVLIQLRKPFAGTNPQLPENSDSC